MKPLPILRFSVFGLIATQAIGPFSIFSVGSIFKGVRFIYYSVGNNMLHNYYAFRRNLLNNFKSFSKSFSKDGNISISGLIFSGFIL